MKSGCEEAQQLILPDDNDGKDEELSLMIHCKLKHFRYNDEIRALRYAAHLDEWSMRCHLDLYIYTNRYPNVKELSWSIGKSSCTPKGAHPYATHTQNTHRHKRQERQER